MSVKDSLEKNKRTFQRNISCVPEIYRAVLIDALLCRQMEAEEYIASIEKKKEESSYFLQRASSIVQSNEKYQKGLVTAININPYSPEAYDEWKEELEYLKSLEKTLNEVPSCEFRSFKTAIGGKK